MLITMYLASLTFLNFTEKVVSTVCVKGSSFADSFLSRNALNWIILPLFPL